MESLPLDKVKPGMILAETVFGNRSKLVNKGTRLDSVLIELLRKARVSSVWVTENEADLTRTSILESPESPNQIYISLLKLMQDIRTKVLTEANFDMLRVAKAVQRVVDQVVVKYRPFSEWVRGRKGSSLPAEHMVDVCFLCAAFGKALGMSQYEIRELAVCALLHDIGKFFIPDSLLNKKGELTSDEQFLVMKHTIMGHDLLSTIKGVSKNMLAVAAQHHERMDGSGYPYGFSRDNLHKYSQIVGLADEYTALLNGDANGVRFAYWEMAEMLGMYKGLKFESDLVTVFINDIVSYPILSKVRLNTGEVGKVVMHNKQFPMRPIVKVGNERTDLSKSPTVFIEELLECELY